MKNPFPSIFFKIIPAAVLFLQVNGLNGQCIVINEFVVDPKDGNNGDASATGEFIELYNSCSCSVDIGCYVVCFTDNSSGRRGDCFTIPSGTTLAAGAVYTMGGYGTNCTGGVSTCDWPALSLNLNWHANATKVWDVVNNAFYTTNSGKYIGVLADGGEDITLFDGTGTMLGGVYYSGGAGITSNNTENIGPISGCPAKSVTIPPTGSHTNLGSSCGSCGADEGWGRRCDATWGFRAKAAQNPGTPESCALSSCVLPVELISFTGKAENNMVKLEWATAIETNSDYFLVERSADGYNFETLATVKGAGNSSDITAYEYIDENPLYETVYYRLRQVDLNGNYEYSGMIATELEGRNNFTIYPNPGENAITVNFTAARVGDADIIITDILGRTEFYQKECLAEGRNSVFLDLSSIRHGAYFITIKDRSAEKLVESRFYKN